MSKVAQFVGLDVHKDTISIAVAEGGAFAEPRDLGRVPHDMNRLWRKLERLGPPEALHVAYEAGPTGYGLCRWLLERGVDCVVVAPSKTPQRSGDRVKTDRRDAAKLARYMRSGELVAVGLPSAQQEALRDLVRAREDAMRAQHRARQQLSCFLLRHGRHWEGKSSWTQAHLAWIRSQRFDTECQRQVLEDYFNEVTRLAGRLKDLTGHVEQQAAQADFKPLFEALQALKGVSVIVAATIIAEIGDLLRFAKPTHLMSYVGLVPSEYSSGARTQRGAITKAGNPHVRRVLIQAAWCSQSRPAMSLHLKRRNDRVPLPVRDIAWKAQKRLHQRCTRMLARGKTKQTTVVAMARELVGFIWAIGQQMSPARG